MAKSDKSLIIGLSANVPNKNNISCLISMISCNGSCNFTNLDISKQDCTFKLNKKSQDLCVIITLSFNVDWQTIICNREVLVDNDLLKSTQKLINYNYFVWEAVLKYDQKSKFSLPLKALAPLRLYAFMWTIPSQYSYRLVWWKK